MNRPFAYLWTTSSNIVGLLSECHTHTHTQASAPGRWTARLRRCQKRGVVVRLKCRSQAKLADLKAPFATTAEMCWGFQAVVAAENCQLEQTRRLGHPLRTCAKVVWVLDCQRSRFKISQLDSELVELEVTLKFSTQSHIQLGSGRAWTGYLLAPVNKSTPAAILRPWNWTGISLRVDSRLCLDVQCPDDPLAVTRTCSSAASTWTISVAGTSRQTQAFDGGRTRRVTCARTKQCVVAEAEEKKRLSSLS